MAESHKHLQQGKKIAAWVMARRPFLVPVRRLRVELSS